MTRIRTARTPRALTRARALALVAVAAMLPIAGASGASAGHLTPSPVAIMQDGDGRGTSLPVKIENSDQRLDDFFMRSTLFNGNRFPLPNGQTQRPGFRKYASWGTVTLPSGDHRLAFTTSDDGVNWTEPVRATIQDEDTGQDVPFIIGNINNLRQFAVVYTPNFIDFQFQIYYMRHDPGSPGDVYDITNFRRALSNDGVTWVDNPCDPTTLVCSLDSDPAHPWITGSGSGGHKEGSYGPTDVHYQPNASDAATCHTGPTGPWGCRYVMYYDTVGGSNETTGIAWSPDGFTWSGSAAPVIGNGAPGEWDDTYATMTHVQRRSAHDFVAYYSGGQAPPSACYGGLAPCLSLGTAVSTDGLTFTKTNAAPAINPMTPNDIASSFLPDAPHSLWHAQAVGDAGGGKAKIFFSLLDDGVGESMLLARQHEVPAGPSYINIRIDNPLPGATPPTETVMTAYVTDFAGSPQGIDSASITASLENLDTLVVTPLGGLQKKQSLVGGMTQAAVKVTKTLLWDAIPDGRYGLTISATDLEGLTASKTVEFSIDRTPPDTIVTSDPVTPAIVFPGGSIGSAEGETVDLTSPVLGVRAIVTNPLGLQKAFDVNYATGQPSNPSGGFTNLVRSTDGRSLTWRWVAPTLDLHMALPGPYIISFIGYDTNGNVEKPDIANTVEVFVI